VSELSSLPKKYYQIYITDMLWGKDELLITTKIQTRFIIVSDGAMFRKILTYI